MVNKNTRYRISDGTSKAGLLLALDRAFDDGKGQKHIPAILKVEIDGEETEIEAKVLGLAYGETPKQMIVTGYCTIPTDEEKKEEEEEVGYYSITALYNTELKSGEITFSDSE